MGWWRTFLDSLDSDGGHILILMGLIVGAFAIIRFDWASMKAGEIITGAFGALLMMLKSAGSNRDAVPPAAPPAPFAPPTEAPPS